MPSVGEDIGAQLDSALSLVVGRTLEAGGEAFRVRLADDAVQGFRAQVSAARDRIASSTAVPYTALVELEAGEHLFLDDADSVAELSDLRDVVRGAGDLAPIKPTELDARIGFYAIGIGRGDQRIVFVKRTDPRIVGKPGRFLAVAKERLERVDDSVFTFSEDFDLVIGSDWAVVFHQSAFERLARETGIVERNVTSWLTGITDALPMNTASLDTLRETAMRDSRTWRRLRDIKRRGHLADITIEQVAAYAGQVGLATDSVVRDGELYFDPEERFGFLHLLSEDLYRGALTGERFESQRKASMN